MTIGVIHMHRMRSSIYIAIATFFAGVYGMNVREPEVTSPWGYPGFWLAGVVTVIAMLLYFRRKQWILQLTTLGKGYNCDNRRCARPVLFTDYFPAPEDDRAPFCVRRPRVDALHISVRRIFSRRQAKGYRTPRVLEDRRIMEQGRERVSAQRIGFCKHDVRPVCDNAIPDRMHRAYPPYLVHSNFQHPITLRDNNNSPLYHLVGTKYRMRATPRAKYVIRNRRETGCTRDPLAIRRNFFDLIARNL
ncbi:MAG: CorA family divalent cation transporter [Halobacteriota archaeon]